MKKSQKDYQTRDTVNSSKVIPDFFIVGAPKCGTTSLYKYLKNHPDIFLPEQKELHYFSSKQLQNRAMGPGDADAISRICTDLSSYQKHFEQRNLEKVAGDISPSYLFYAEVAESIKEYNPNAKIIIVLRNPAKKAFSQYCHLLRSGQESKSFSDALKDEDMRISSQWNDMWYYTEGSRYYRGVKKYIDTFGEANVKVILFEDMISDLETTIGDLLSFIGVSGGLDIETDAVHNKGYGKSRFGRISMSLVRNEKLKKVIRSLLSPNMLKSLKKITFRIMFKEKNEIASCDYKTVMSTLESDIIDLENLIGRRTGWL